VSEGAKLLAGGERARVDSGGFYVLPTIFDNVRNDMTIAREEIFGPVLSVLAFDDVAEAVRAANATSYGLQASVWTRDINKAHKVARALRAGTVHVNQYDEDDITVPFGGYKQSGNGRDKSLHALDKYTELKTTWIRLPTRTTGFLTWQAITDLHQRRLAATPRGISVMGNFFIDRAENAEMWDVEGRRFIDFAGGIAVLNTGHRHPKVMAALAAQLEALHAHLLPGRALRGLRHAGREDQPAHTGHATPRRPRCSRPAPRRPRTWSRSRAPRPSARR
jgi:hypothetical protein